MTFINSIKKESNNIVLKELDAPAPELLITDRDSISIAFKPSDCDQLHLNSDVTKKPRTLKLN